VDGSFDGPWRRTFPWCRVAFVFLFEHDVGLFILKM
jgi:hypothetical protein